MVFALIAISAVATAALAAKVVIPDMIEEQRRNALAAGDEWTSVADHFGLSFLPGSRGTDNELMGTINGFPVRVSRTERSMEASMTRFFVQLPASDAPPMSIRKRRLSARELHDPLRFIAKNTKRTFDETVQVTSEDDEAAQRFLTPARKQALQRFFTEMEPALVTDSLVEVEFIEYQPRAASMISSISTLLDVAMAMSPPQDRQLDSPQDREQPINLTEALNDLLGSTHDGFEADERFARYYRGRQVESTGTVDVVHDFTHDSDFGENGRKVLVDLGDEHDASIVLSVAQTIPVDRGDEVTFAGTLLRFDRLARHLFLGDTNSFVTRS